MKTKKNLTILLCFVTTLILIAPVAINAQVTPCANPVFIEASVYIGSTMRAEFTASTMVTCSSICVSSCTLQKKVGTRWVYAKSLSVPSYVANNTFIYDDVKNYDDDIPAGGTYRLKVVFSGGGETVTRYSNSQTK